jgi:hypothetical protein
MRVVADPQGRRAIGTSKGAGVIHAESFRGRSYAASVPACSGRVGGTCFSTSPDYPGTVPKHVLRDYMIRRTIEDIFRRRLGSR